MLDPFEFIEKDGYFYGRGTSDDKQGVIGTTAALFKLRAEGFKPDRDILVYYTSDEETEGEGARMGATELRQLLDAEYALNADAGGGGFRRDGQPARLRRPDRREDLPGLQLDRDQPRRPFEPAAPGQCDLRSDAGAEPAFGSIASSRR